MTIGLIASSLAGQDRPVQGLTPAGTGLDTLPPPALGIDTLPFGDSLRIDLSRVAMSKDSLDAPVDYSAVDSMISDFTTEKIHLYGQAEVKYTTITLKAGYIVLDYATKIVTAEGRRDSLGQLVELPEFSDGAQTFTAERMRYNFETRKGIVYDVTSQYQDVVVQGSRTKFVTGEEEPPADPADTTNKANDILYSQNAIFTTCNHDDPHFGIRSKKQKVIPDKLVVVGPSNLELMGVPTPLWLPFGFFPITKGRRTGLIFPRDYEYSEQWGFGVRDLGWFFPLGEHFNLSLTTNLYVKGTWGVNAYSQYRKRYKYNGSLRLGYDSRRSEDNEGNINRNNSFGLSWSHNQDRSAHPTVTFGGTINIQTNNYQSTVFNDPANVLPTQLNSNFRFEKRWTDKPFNFGASFNHSQNTATGRMTINFPTLNFQTQALYPFKRKVPQGKPAWYESVVVRYRGEAKNRFETTDTTLFEPETLRDAQFGVQHDVSTGMSFKLFRYFNLNPSFNYEEVWYTRATNIDFVDGPVIEFDTIYNADSSLVTIVPDTLALGTLDTTDLYGFKSYRTYNAALSLNTQIFGTMRFQKGWLRGLRHVIKPSVSLGFAPDYLNTDYFDFYPSDLNDPFNPDKARRYSIYDGSIFGPPPASERQMALSYSLNNIFEAKIFSRKDSTEKKVKLMDNIIINGSYNFAADSLKWSPVSMSGTTRFFKGATTFRFGAQFDPYVIDASGRRINRTAWKELGTPLRFVRANAAFNTRLTIDKIKALFQGKEEEVVEDVEEERERRREERRQGQTEDGGLLSLFSNFSLNHNLVMQWTNSDDPRRKPFEITTNSLNIQGRLSISKHWNVNISSFGYDFVRKNLTYPFVGFSRDLHCWEMGMNWAPTRGTYQFFIRVKPGSLDFLKVPYDRNNADGIRAF